MSHQEQKEEEFSLKQYFVPLTTTKAIHFIIIIGLIVYFNSLFNGFVGDDELQITINPAIHSIGNIPNFFSGSSFFNGGQELSGHYYKPLLTTSYVLTYALFKLNAFGFHFVQIVFYIANACLAFLVLKRFFRISLAFILATIFLVHPINSESAFYIADMQEVMFFFFGILALLTLQKYESQKAIILAVFCLFLSMLSKETGVLFLTISVIYMFIYKRKNFLPLLGYSLVAVGTYFILRMHAVGFGANSLPAPIERLSLLDRLVNIPLIFFYYIKTFIFPLYLATAYHWVYTQIDITHFLLPLFIDLLFIGAITFAEYSVYKRSSKKYVNIYIFFAIWFLIGVVFHLQILPLDQTVAERWFYFPIVGILGMIGVLIEVFHVDLKNKWVISITVIIIVLLSARTFMRSLDWKDNATLVTHDTKVSKNSFSLESELSHIYLLQGKYEDARIHAQKSIELYPYSVVGYTQLGNAYFRLGDYKEAYKAYMKGLDYGDYYVAYENLAVLAINYGDPKKNIDFLKNVAVKRHHQDAKIWLYLAVLEYMHGSKEDAKLDIQYAYKYNQDSTVLSVYYAIMNDKPLVFTK